MRGPAPKEPDKRRRRNVDLIPTTVLVGEPDGEVRGPELPGGIDWPVVTLAWWETWRRSPQAQAFIATDWDFMVDTALLHARFWTGDEKVAGELRLRVAKFGATPEDRLRLRLQLGDPPKPKPSRKSTDDPYSGLKIQS